MKHVIIGAGAAGITAASTIRKNRPTDEIIIISTDNFVYSRCILDKYISGERDEAALSFVPADFFETNKITWIKNTSVTEIDTKNKKVIFENGSETYDKLLVATGATPSLPPLDGLKGTKRVYSLRDLSDAKSIREKAKTANNIVIIGAGLVGLDAAYGLVNMNKKPTIIDIAPSVLSANLDERGAKIYQQHFEEAGANFILNAKVKKINQNADTHVSGILLSDDKEIACDLLVVATGVKPNNNMLPQGTINDNLSIDTDVYVAGDATGYSESWPSAMATGEIAALNMSGIPTKYDEISIARNTINFFGIASMSLGKINPSPDDKVEIREDKKRYQKIIINNGAPIGVILQGDISRSGFWQQLIKKRFNIYNTEKPIWKISFADSYSLNDQGEYEWLD